MNYGLLVKKLRDKLIITQEDMAKLLGVSFSSINRWENGHYQPTTKIKRRIIDMCKLNGIEINEDRING